MVRKTELSVTYNGTDITTRVSPYITAFSFTERARHGESDELSVTFANPEKLWSTGWFPERGASLHASLQLENWYQPGDSLTLDCGRFEIDDLTDSGPPSLFSVGALSVGITSGIRGQEHSRAWENMRLSVIVSQLAARHGLTVFFDSQYDPVFDRFDQKSQSDLAFILKIAEYAGLQVRLSHGKLIVYQDSLYDRQDVALTLTRNFDGYKHHQLRAASADIYTACQVQFLDSSSRKLLTYQYAPEGSSGVLEGTSTSGTGSGSGKSSVSGLKVDPVTRMVIPSGKSGGATTAENKTISAPPVGKVLKINRRCSSLAEAERLAKSMLRNKNRRELSGSVSLMGNVMLRAGMVCALSDFGRWDSARYVMEEVSHQWSKSEGLTTDVSLRGVMGF